MSKETDETRTKRIDGFDVAIDAATSERLSKIPQTGTKPEMLVRKMVHALGHRYRVTNRDLPGSPDLANRSKKWVIFVHGCYWHHHDGCSRSTIPKRNRDFWLAKFERNRERDRAAVSELHDLGYHVLVVWECELTEVAVVIQSLKAFFGCRLAPSGSA